ncbi:hypothetical protein OROGR_006737 [Orobanche gracilis]
MRGGLGLVRSTVRIVDTLLLRTFGSSTCAGSENDRGVRAWIIVGHYGNLDMRKKCSGEGMPFNRVCGKKHSSPPARGRAAIWVGENVTTRYVVSVMTLQLRRAFWLACQKMGKGGDNSIKALSARMHGLDLTMKGIIAGDRYDPHSCSCNHHPDYRSRLEPHITRVARDPKYVNKVESLPDISKPYHRGNREINCRPKSKIISGNTPITKRVWELLDSQKKCIRSNSDSDVTVRSTPKVKPSQPNQLAECCSTSSDELTDISVQTNHDRDLTRLGAENGLCKMEKPQDSSMLSSSNSDNGSSCPSKGDSNVDSNAQYPESTTTSDSEESSQISDGKENPNRLENTACHGVVKEQSTLKGQDEKIQETAYVGTNSLRGRESSISIIGAQPQSLPPVHSRIINYPIFQAPTMGYYHQNPVPWQPGPMDGLMSFPHSSHYLYPSGFGYGLNQNASFVQYGSLQHLAPPLISHAHGPVFQPLSQVNGVSIKEPTKVAYSIPKLPLTDRSGKPTCVDDGRNRKADKTDMESNVFSLFHFGGPVALPTGFKADLVSLNEGIMQDEEKSSDNCPDGDRPCGKKDSFEYNLFAASNGIKFSIF